MNPSEILRKARYTWYGEDFEMLKAVFRASGADPYDLFDYLDALQFLKDAEWDFDRAVELAESKE